MANSFVSGTGLMAELTISAIYRISENPASWKEPSVHKAILLSGLSLLIAANEVIENDLEIS